MQVTRYTTIAGWSPFDDWYQRLNSPAAAKITAALERLEQGNLSNVKPAGSGVLEFRIDFGPGYRIYFGRDGQELVILLTSGNKRRQQRDIDAAITYWTDYRRRKRGRSA